MGWGLQIYLCIKLPQSPGLSLIDLDTWLSILIDIFCDLNLALTLNFTIYCIIRYIKPAHLLCISLYVLGDLILLIFNTLIKLHDLFVFIITIQLGGSSTSTHIGNRFCGFWICLYIFHILIHNCVPMLIVINYNSLKRINTLIY